MVRRRQWAGGNDKNVAMISVVIPTMWRSEVTMCLLERYNDCEFVDEILVINNNKADTPYELNRFDKVRIIGRDGNIYVNPSWNLGVAEARNEIVAISNDDILFQPCDLFSFVIGVKDFGAIGMSGLNFYEEASEIGIETGCDIGAGWGCLLFVKKSSWVEIPERIKIWFGDNWIARTCERSGKWIYKVRLNSLIETNMSTTSRSFNDVIENDILEWGKL
jgi:glycosyltransferase involved in cell wall biosynthesis